MTAMTNSRVPIVDAVRTSAGAPPHDSPRALLKPWSGPSAQNRRFVPRVETRFRAVDVDHDVCYEGLNLSFAGLRCWASNPVWPGNVVSLDLDLPGFDGPLRVHARVVEIDSSSPSDSSDGSGYTMRLGFEGMPACARRAIAVWMARGVQGS